MFASRTDWDLTPMRLAAALATRRAAGLPVFDLTESNPTRCGLAGEAEAILGPLAHPGSYRYDPAPLGLPEARAAVARYYADKGADLSPERICLTASTSEAYAFLFRLLADPGDEILVPRPSYPLLDFLAGLNDVQLATTRPPLAALLEVKGVRKHVEGTGPGSDGGAGGLWTTPSEPSREAFWLGVRGRFV